LLQVPLQAPGLAYAFTEDASKTTEEISAEKNLMVSIGRRPENNIYTKERIRVGN